MNISRRIADQLSSLFWLQHKLNEIMQKIKEFLDGVRKEMKKVSWPQQQELIDNTIIVVVFTIIITTFIFGVDQVYSTILEAIYNL